MFLLMLKLLILFTVASVTGNYAQNETLPELKWDKEYTFEATKTSLTSGLVEDIKYWRISRKSRIDYNNGAVKSISVKAFIKSAYVLGVKYEIHPQTTEEYANKLFCTKKNGTITDPVDVEEVLPSVSDFIHVGQDFLDIGVVEKFAKYESESKTYLWAFLNRENSTWIPVRIEELVYNPWLKTLKRHSVWDIINYKTKINKSVFNTDSYNCTDVSEEESAINDDLSLLDPENKNHVELAFNRFKKQYNRRYETVEEYNIRKNIFQNSMRLVENINRNNPGYKITLNKFADRTQKEMHNRMGLRRRKSGHRGTHPFPYDEKKVAELSDSLPSEFDLRLLGVISPVRDQAECGSCWTFGSTSAVEGAIARSNGGRLLRLANQALVDCAWGFGADGCNGGSDTAAYHWMMKYGLPTEEEYGPYENKDGFCRINNMTKLYPIKGFTDVTPFSVEALKIALINHGPLSVSIDATTSLHLYNGGIYYEKDCNPVELNHEVTLVGYGELDGDSYWVVKNSWGKDWGIDGYFHISTRNNSCGITTEPTYAVV